MVRMRRYYEVDDEDAFDERGICRDGRGVHVPLMLTDGAFRDVAARNRAPVLHRPGQVSLTDEQIDIRERARDDWSARKSNAWRTPPTASQDVVELATQLAPLLGLPPPKRNATRSPMANDGQTAIVSRDGADPREAAYAERSRRVRDAWRTPWPGARR
jgi:hypothetical protein